MVKGRDKKSKKTHGKSVHMHGSIPVVQFVTELKRLFGFGPKIKTYKTFWQKGNSQNGRVGNKTPNFRPRDYNAKNPLVAKKMAFEDARHHERFYSAEYPMACRGDETLANFLSQNNDY